MPFAFFLMEGNSNSKVTGFPLEQPPAVVKHFAGMTSKNNSNSKWIPTFHRDDEQQHNTHTP